MRDGSIVGYWRELFPGLTTAECYSAQHMFDHGKTPGEILSVLETDRKYDQEYLSRLPGPTKSEMDAYCREIENPTTVILEPRSP